MSVSMRGVRIAPAPGQHSEARHLAGLLCQNGSHGDVGEVAGCGVGEEGLGEVEADAEATRVHRRFQHRFDGRAGVRAGRVGSGRRDATAAAPGVGVHTNVARGTAQKKTPAPRRKKTAARKTALTADFDQLIEVPRGRQSRGQGVGLLVRPRLPQAVQQYGRRARVVEARVGGGAEGQQDVSPEYRYSGPGPAIEGNLYP
ncbi:hypothetical protein ACIO93_44145 [Streptomyces sp. NPDC087903]|uniref:hypothetical protein n=1 Tax=Streptomyces sp. NPDC087903 TaxID=3365819 RepID=UPI00380F8C98